MQFGRAITAQANLPARRLLMEAIPQQGQQGVGVGKVAQGLRLRQAEPRQG